MKTLLLLLKYVRVTLFSFSIDFFYTQKQQQKKTIPYLHEHIARTIVFFRIQMILDLLY